MGYYTNKELKNMGFKYIGNNVKISTKASIYNHDQIEIDDNSRIDDFCVVSGKNKIGKYVYIGPFCLLAGGEKGIEMEDFTTLAYGVYVLTQSDDYSGETLTNSNIPVKYKNEKKEKVLICRHSIVGTRSVIMPGVILNEGTSVGAMTLILNTTEAWSIYVGLPGKKLKDRSKNMLKLEKQFLNEIS